MRVMIVLVILSAAMFHLARLSGPHDALMVIFLVVCIAAGTACAAYYTLATKTACNLPKLPAWIEVKR